MANEKRLIDPDAKFIEKHFTKRLIDAEAIERKLKNQYCAECNVVRQIQCSACWVNDVLELLDGDSVEVVHGRWIYVDGKGSHAEYECNQCRTHVCFDEQIDGSIPAYNYCPNCGAKMDGDGNG